jgi:predicted metal-dependent hydrolase
MKKPLPSFDEALRAGTARFNRGQFFEAHEEWEVRWLKETGDQKRFLHGLIQIAAGFVKINIKEWPSADGLFQEAQAKLEDFPETVFGVELAPLLDAVARCQGEVRLIMRGVFDAFDLSQIPQLELVVNNE